MCLLSLDNSWTTDSKVGDSTCFEARLPPGVGFDHNERHSRCNTTFTPVAVQSDDHVSRSHTCYGRRCRPRRTRHRGNAQGFRLCVWVSCKNLWVKSVIIRAKSTYLFGLVSDKNSFGGMGSFSSEYPPLEARLYLLAQTNFCTFSRRTSIRVNLRET